MTFERAGSDSDLRSAYVTATIDEALNAGNDALAEAERMLIGADPDVDAAEQVARTALHAFAHALNWAEDSPREETVHQRLDEAGGWIRTIFGCVLEQEGKSYFETCPVKLGHVRVGLSVGGTACRTCSLCGEDLSECEHHRGVAYLVPGGVTDLPWCRVCTNSTCIKHSPGQTYRTGLVALIREMDLVEISFVSKPAQPDARIQRQSIDTADLRTALGEGWAPGMPVNCDFCLQSCRGLRRPMIGADE